MKITDAKVFVGGPGKNYVTLKIMTDTGVYGIGDATLNNRETLPAKYLTDYLIPNIIGMDPRQSEDIWQMMYRDIETKVTKPSACNAAFQTCQPQVMPSPK